MWIEMSQYIPNTAIVSEPTSHVAGSAAQPFMPVTFSAVAARRAKTGIRPVRCPATRMSSTAVPARPIAVARIPSPMAAPPAGGWLAAIAANVTLSFLLRVRGPRASDVEGVKHQGSHDEKDRPAEERHVHKEMSGVRDQRHGPGELLPGGELLTRS